MTSGQITAYMFCCPTIDEIVDTVTLSAQPAAHWDIALEVSHFTRYINLRLTTYLLTMTFSVLISIYSKHRPSVSLKHRRHETEQRNKHKAATWQHGLLLTESVKQLV